MFLPLMYIAGDSVIILKKIWWIILLSGLVNGGVFWFISHVCRIGGDVSYITPLRQAFYILSSAVLSIIAGNMKEISLFAYIGFVLIIIGCLLLPVISPKHIQLKDYINSITFFCFMAGLFAAVSALFDSVTLKSFGDSYTPLQKTFAFMALYRFATVLGLLPFLFFDRIKYSIDFRKEKPDYIQALEIGVCVTVAYVFVCCAYPLAPDVSYVVALRLMALPLSIIGGIAVFREKIFFGKIAGSLFIIGGLVLTALN